MVRRQATVQIENRGDTVETKEIKSVMLLCKNNQIFLFFFLIYFFFHLDKLGSQRLHVVTRERARERETFN